MMHRAIVTGAAGFIGANLTEQLIKKGYKVIAVVRPDSLHNNRISELSSNDLTMIPLEMENISSLPALVENYDPGLFDTFYHLALHGGRNNRDIQQKNIADSMKALEAAAQLNCKRFVCTGSQAEYGAIRDQLITEDLLPDPFSAYGAAKVAICHLTRVRAAQLGLEWVWGRIFSVIGRYEPNGRMLPDLIRKMKQGESMILSSCEQNWDYLDAQDAANALIALGERGKNGEIYNIANGEYHKLKYFTEIIRRQYGPTLSILYGNDPDPFVSLQPSVEKIQKDTGWKAEIRFEESLLNY